MKRSDLETAQVSGLTSWPKRWISAPGLIGGAEDVAVLAQADRDVLLGDREHAAGAAAGS